MRNFLQLEPNHVGIVARCAYTTSLLSKLPEELNVKNWLPLQDTKNNEIHKKINVSSRQGMLSILLSRITFAIAKNTQKNKK